MFIDHVFYMSLKDYQSLKWSNWTGYQIILKFIWNILQEANLTSSFIMMTLSTNLKT